MGKINEKDKAGEEYWSNYWKSVSIPDLLQPKNKSYRHFQTRLYDRFFKEGLKNEKTENKSILEIGCANSVWLPYFHLEFKMKLFGLDYSEVGCEMERRLLQKHDIPATIICSDFNNPPEEIIGKMDYVVSMGVVEHFTNTEEVIRSFSKFLKPGGILITTIPNVAGVGGFLQKTLNKQVYDIHVPLTLSDLKKGIEKAGFQTLATEYTLMPSLYAVLDENPNPVRFLFIKKMINKIMIYKTILLWWFQSTFFEFKPVPYFSAAILNISKKK